MGSVRHSYSISDVYAASIQTTQTNAVGTSPPRNANASSVSGIFNGGIQDSRWGLRGREALGAEFSAVFVLESGINLPTGRLNNNAGGTALSDGSSTAGASSSFGGQLFSRQAWFGLRDDTWGQLTVGRQYQPIYDIVVDYDPV